MSNVHKKYRKYWTVVDADGDRLTWAQCGRVGDSLVRTVSYELAARTADSACVNGYPGARLTSVVERGY